MVRNTIQLTASRNLSVIWCGGNNTMYLHLGKGWVVNTDDIIGIFDLDITSQSHLTRKYLSMAEKAGQVINASEDIPKSFVVCWDGKKESLYLCQMATATLLKRAESGIV